MFVENSGAVTRRASGAHTLRRNFSIRRAGRFLTAPNQAGPARSPLGCDVVATDLLADASTRKSAKITIASTKFGRSAILELMILAPDFQALDISMGGMRPSCEKHREGRARLKNSGFKRRLPTVGPPRLNEGAIRDCHSLGHPQIERDR